MIVIIRSTIIITNNVCRELFFARPEIIDAREKFFFNSFISRVAHVCHYLTGANLGVTAPVNLISAIVLCGGDIHFHEAERLRFIIRENEIRL